MNDDEKLHIIKTEYLERHNSITNGIGNNENFLCILFLCIEISGIVLNLSRAWFSVAMIIGIISFWVSICSHQISLKETNAKYDHDRFHLSEIQNYDNKILAITKKCVLWDKLNSFTNILESILVIIALLLVAIYA